MKVGSLVLGLHIVAVCALVLTEGCVTTDSDGSGLGAAARHRGPWHHEHSAKPQPVVVVKDDSSSLSGSAGSDSVIDDSVIIESSVPETVYVESAKPAAPAAPATQTYIVQKGDILSKIAVRFGTTTKTLVSMNSLSNPDVLYVGQELRVPAGSGTSAPSTAPARHAPSVKKGGKYVIQRGDSLSEIAVAAGVSIADLRALNNIQGDKIYAGETLYIPSYGKVPSTSRKKSSPKKKKSQPAPTPKPVAPAVEEPAPAPMAAAPMAVEEPDVDVADDSSMSVDTVIDHVVYPGETLDDIARENGVSKSEIMRLNNITDETQLKEGQRLRIPVSE